MSNSNNPFAPKRPLNRVVRGSAELAAIHDLNGRKGAGVLVICTSLKRVLLGKRGPDGASPGTWAPFGGMVELSDPSVIFGAFRELGEEAGVFYDVTNPGVLQSPLYVTHDDTTGFEFHTFAILVDGCPDVSINQESIGYGWFNLTDLPSDLHPGAYEMFSDPIVRGVLETFIK